MPNADDRTFTRGMHRKSFKSIPCQQSMTMTVATTCHIHIFCTWCKQLKLEQANEFHAEIDLTTCRVVPVDSGPHAHFHPASACPSPSRKFHFNYPAYMGLNSLKPKRWRRYSWCLSHYTYMENEWLNFIKVKYVWT